MKWILLLLAIGAGRGIIFPDYRFGPNAIIIPFVTPALIAALAFYWATKYAESKTLFFVVGLVAVYLSEMVGLIVYGWSAGWHYVTNDLETRAVAYLTLIVQTIVYIVSSGVAVASSRNSN